MALFCATYNQLLINTFYSRRYDSYGLVSVCWSACVSVTCRHCIKTVALMKLLSGIPASVNLCSAAMFKGIKVLPSETSSQIMGLIKFDHGTSTVDECDKQASRRPVTDNICDVAKCRQHLPTIVVC